MIVEPGKPALFITVTFALQEQPDRDRRQGPGKAVGSEHREHDGEAERVNKYFAGPSRKTTEVNKQLIANVDTRSERQWPAEPCKVACGSGCPFLGQQAMSVLDRPPSNHRPGCR